MTSVRELRQKAGFDVATVAARLAISEPAVLAIEACPLASTSIGALQ